MTSDPHRKADSSGDESALLQFPVEPDAVDAVLDTLEDTGVDSGSTTVLLRAEVATTGSATTSYGGGP